MYGVMLFLHSLLRWVALILLVARAGRGVAGWAGKQPWGPVDRRLGAFTVAALDLQLLLGLALYWLSPITRSAMQDMGAAMKDPSLRFFAVEHLTLMLAAVVLAHLGSALSKRASTDPGRHRRAAIFFVLATVLVLVGIPWPFGQVPRPWLSLP